MIAGGPADLVARRDVVVHQEHVEHGRQPDARADRALEQRDRDRLHARDPGVVHHRDGHRADPARRERLGQLPGLGGPRHLFFGRHFAKPPWVCACVPRLGTVLPGPGSRGNLVLPGRQVQGVEPLWNGLARGYGVPHAAKPEPGPSAGRRKPRLVPVRVAERLRGRGGRRARGVGRGAETYLVRNRNDEVVRVPSRGVRFGKVVSSLRAPPACPARNPIPSLSPPSG